MSTAFYSARWLVLFLAVPFMLPGQQAGQGSPAQPATPSPVPSADQWLTGFIDLGFRWRGVAGNEDAYRNIVNLGSGPKLFSADFTVRDPKKRAFDNVHVRAFHWGDEPYELLHVDATKSNIYNVNADYRNIALFTFLPSYADPLYSQGITLDEQGLDERNHLTSISLDLLPLSHVVPYFAFDRDFTSGTGISTFVSLANQYPVQSSFSYSMNSYRGGVRLQFRRFHFTLEQGGTTISEYETLFQSPGSINYGNNDSKLFLQQTLYLTQFLADYRISGSSIYSKGVLTATPASWVDLYGQFLFSQPETNVNYVQTATGNLVIESQLLFYSSQLYLSSAAAKMPHTTASAGAEIRPARKVRILEAWLTDRLHNSGNQVADNQLSGIQQQPQTSETINSMLASSLVYNYNQNEIDVFYDPTPKLTLRGGYRYVWGSGNQVILPIEGLAGLVQASLSRNIGIASATYRSGRKLFVTAEAEGGASGDVYFRRSLYNYERVRGLVRYRPADSLNVVGDFTYLNNETPIPSIDYNYQFIQGSLSVGWTPKSGKFGDYETSYTRVSLSSNINYLVPQTLTPAVSRYTENGNTWTALFNFTFPRKIKLTAGGSFFTNSGSRPTNFFEPTGTLWVPVQKHVTLFAEYSYYGYGQPFYVYEGYRANAVIGGIRFTR
jgi:hypothetical protein